MTGQYSMMHMLRFFGLVALCGAFALPAGAQSSGSDIFVRLDQLEGQIRALTGQIEQLQYRNQQLENQLRRMQEEGGARQQAMAPPARSSGAPPGAAGGAGRGDAFDPNQNPRARSARPETRAIRRAGRSRRPGIRHPS